MKTQLGLQDITLNSVAKKQIGDTLDVLNNLFGSSLLGVYLYGSSVLGGLLKYSDIDFFVVLSRGTTHEEKNNLVKALLQISGIYMKSDEHPIELTIVNQSAVNPWRYPPRCDFQYGEWLRADFEAGALAVSSDTIMPDLAVLITQIFLKSITLVGGRPEQLLCPVPYNDFILATVDALPHLMAALERDIRNVLLTLARIWNTLATSTILPKPSAAQWVMALLPEEYKAVMQRAKAICEGKESEHWDDVQLLIKPCADFMYMQISNNITQIMQSDNQDKAICLI